MTQAPDMTPGKRWTPGRKVAVVEAIRSGQMTRADAIERYDLTEDELLNWIGKVERYGPGGVRLRSIDERRSQARAS